jgi:hypothetical protein
MNTATTIDTVAAVDKEVVGQSTEVIEKLLASHWS